MFEIERICDGKQRVITRREMDLLISAVKAEMQMIEDHAARTGMNKHLQERHNELYGLMLALKDVHADLPEWLQRLIGQQETLR